MTQKKYERIAQLFAVNCSMDGSIVQPSLGSKRKKGAEYVRSRNEDEFHLDDASIEERTRVFEALFQPSLAYQIFLPQNKSMFEQVMQGNYPKEIYVGLGYNPDLSEKGERIDMLDFFSWFKRYHDAVNGARLTVWNAASYQVVNEHNREMDFDYSDNVAKAVLNTIQDLFDVNRTVASNSSLRAKYIQTMIDLFGVNAQVISAEERLGTVLFSNCVQRALDFCREPEQQKLKILKSVRKNNGSFDTLYTSLEAAEALYLAEIHGIDYKLGPTSEAPFDRFILDISRMISDVPFKMIWYSMPPNRPASYIKCDQNCIYLTDSPKEVRVKLQDSSYAQWLGDVVKPFNNPSLSLEENIHSISQAILKKI